MTHTARVGVFMLIALAVLGVFIIKIEEIPIGTKGGRYQVKAAFPSVAGLDEKSPVRIAGVRVGIVESIALEGNHAVATLAIDQGVQLHQGATAEVTSLGMLGDKYVELRPGDLAAPPLAADAVLTGTSPVGFDQLLKGGNDVLGDVKEVTASLRHSLGGPEGAKRLDEIIDNIRQLTAQVRAMVADNRSNVDVTLANFRAFSEKLPQLADKVAGLANRLDIVVDENRTNLSETIANAKDLSARLRTAADNINQISGKIARGEGTIGKLVNDETTVDNLNATLKSVEDGVHSLKDTFNNTLGRAERWRLDMNARSETLPSLATDSSRSAVGLDLHTTPKRFFRLEMVDSPAGRNDKTTETIATTYPDGHVDTITQSVSRTTNSATVNAQVGYHLDGLTVRAGLFESKGGVGVDTDLLRQRLRLTLEAYDFNRDTKPPHIRFESRYYLTKNLFAYTGVDDPTWSGRRSVLFGGGVTWQDDDLKYLLGTASSLGH